MNDVAARVSQSMGVLSHVFQFMTQSAYAQHHQDEGICDFAVGNPHEMPLPGFTQALQKWSVPQDKDWFAYKTSEPYARAAVAASLRRRRGIAYDEEDVIITNGAFGALAVTLNALVGPGDEVIFVSPPWFFYEALILTSGATPVRVRVDMQSFDLDLAALARAITSRTRAVIVNSPNNPTGKIYPPPTLEALAQLLTEASERHAHAIYLLSDEAYHRIVYDGHDFHSPTEYYPNALMIYTYGKQLLTPGQRLGYIALPPQMPNRETIRPALMLSQFMTGAAVANAVMQRALPDLEDLSIDISHLQAKRDRMVGALREMGYDVHVPEGTFYLLPRAPIADDMRFINLLAQRKIFCLPGTIVEMPGYFRISLTANDAMVERSLAGFESARAEALHDGKG
jgi:aspartate aminotransferase